jgi:hypothetical protein
MTQGGPLATQVASDDAGLAAAGRARAGGCQDNGSDGARPGGGHRRRSSNSSSMGGPLSSGMSGHKRRASSTDDEHDRAAKR